MHHCCHYKPATSAQASDTCRPWPNPPLSACPRPRHASRSQRMGIQTSDGCRERDGTAAGAVTGPGRRPPLHPVVSRRRPSCGRGRPGVNSACTRMHAVRARECRSKPAGPRRRSGGAGMPSALRPGGGSSELQLPHALKRLRHGTLHDQTPGQLLGRRGRGGILGTAGNVKEISDQQVILTAQPCHRQLRGMRRVACHNILQ